ncbi:rhomboid family intramembrane serine protease [Chryseobacterium koreense]|uniref:Membrane protein n=2 Tax=root TaxID=1 RepID=A0A0J7IV50_9FLAO|nr:rhomboid family intramembrane serine protease [Chryseobacterium koreense]KMQ70128.1 membrane protein [Chryseobacterium koreense CCUG 49689]MBB5332330.1 membrane associated rhomboid family serine protease [Chryseobacterium koreense]
MFKHDSLNYKAVIYAAIMVSLMWLGYLFQHIGLLEGCSGAIIPLVPAGLKGVIFSPFLHGNLEHIFGNSVPMFVLIFLLFQFYPIIAKKVFFLGWFLSGFLVWLLPPIDILTGNFNYVCIIGASGIVYVLAFFIFFSGVFRWNMKLLTISMLVALYYGGLIWGMMPEELFSTLAAPSRISWQSHLSGGVIGILMAFIFRNIGDKKKKFIWEFPNYYSEKDDKLWQDYKEAHPEDFEELPYRKKENIWDRLDELRRNDSPENH